MWLSDLWCCSRNASTKHLKQCNDLHYHSTMQQPQLASHIFLQTGCNAEDSPRPQWHAAKGVAKTSNLYRLVTQFSWGCRYWQERNWQQDVQCPSAIDCWCTRCGQNLIWLTTKMGGVQPIVPRGQPHLPTRNRMMGTRPNCRTEFPLLWRS